MSLGSIGPRFSLDEKNQSRRTSENARCTWDLSQLRWQVVGFTPNLWAIDKYTDIHDAPDAEIGPIAAQIPGSVQMALLNAGLVPDWNVGLNSRQLEWVENRDWIYQTQIPDEWLRHARKVRLRCLGLDYCGAIQLNGVDVKEFANSFTQHEADLTTHLKPSGNLLQIWFQQSPRWLGQFGHTSQVREWKPRFNYSWDWTVRLVQIGIWDSIFLDVLTDSEIGNVRVSTSVAKDAETGNLQAEIAATGGSSLEVLLRRGDTPIRKQRFVLSEGRALIDWSGLTIDLWWPNGLGSQPLYDLEIRLLSSGNEMLDMRHLRVGFRSAEWRHTMGAPVSAYPYLCTINGKEIFLFGINWTPIRSNFADLREEDYRKRIALYRDLGVNLIRVWGGGFAEREWLYDLCDEAGILIWQEFPLSSSGLDNDPPDDNTSIKQLAAIAQHYIRRLAHHPAILVWCGGNELAEDRRNHASSQPALTIAHHPMLQRLASVVQTLDPSRAFLPTSPLGPVGSFSRSTCGAGKHWDVHGPWRFSGRVDKEWRDLWQNDDAMFHSEFGAPSASPAELIRKYRGDLSEFPGTHSSPLWNRQPWWIDWPEFLQENGRNPKSLEEFVAWSQMRQSDALTVAVSAARSRFPACGGIIIWMGHDCFPCTANTSIVDYDGNPKPAAIALKKLIRMT